ncbi:MAG: HupE/UreJ family protein [Pseudomonadota bacterium]|nr:HupE/UreJ family protein [Pseudomonadota bacterium]
MKIARYGLLLLALFSASAHAHRPSDAYVTLTVDGSQLSGQWEIALRDLDAAAGVDSNGDGQITWGELRLSQVPLEAALLPALVVHGDGMPCTLKVADLLVNDRLEGRFAWFALEGTCPRTPTVLKVRYGFLFGLDPSHRGILVLHRDQKSHTAVLSPSKPDVEMTLASVSLSRQFVDYLIEGVWHIWMGFDHVLFLLALLLPAVLIRVRGRWEAQPTLSSALWPVLGIVTAFTVAHSITLSLAAFDVLRLPSRWVESAIAASVLLAALNNLIPVATRGLWLAAFVFGLIHGFGFASALSELGLPAGSRVLCLVAFNLGVESGQLAIVAVLMPLAYLSRHTKFYRMVILSLGSTVVAVIAAIWLWQRLAGA